MHIIAQFMLLSKKVDVVTILIIMQPKTKPPESKLPTRLMSKMRRISLKK